MASLGGEGRWRAFSSVALTSPAQTTASGLAAPRPGFHNVIPLAFTLEEAPRRAGSAQPPSSRTGAELRNAGPSFCPKAHLPPQDHSSPQKAGLLLHPVAWPHASRPCPAVLKLVRDLFDSGTARQTRDHCLGRKVWRSHVPKGGARCTVQGHVGVPRWAGPRAFGGVFLVQQH